MDTHPPPSSATPANHGLAFVEKSEACEAASSLKAKAQWFVLTVVVAAAIVVLPIGVALL